jgi:integrase
MGRQASVHSTEKSGNQDPIIADKGLGEPLRQARSRQAQNTYGRAWCHAANHCSQRPRRLTVSAYYTPSDADDWRRWLLAKLGENTTRRYCGRAKQFFRAAVRKRLIPESPFSDMRNCNVQANRDRDYFVSRKKIEKALDSCPDAEWCLIIALSRYGGVRTPSETLLLEWTDVDWEHSRMTVHRPKTEHFEGKESRVIPIFRELRPYLDRAFDEAEPGAVHLITRYRSSRANLRTQFQRILRRAGVPAWPKLFQNCRASRATELAAEYPAHVAAEWLGHSTLVAQKHYWRVTEEDFARAIAEPSEKAVQNPVQSGSICRGSRGGKPVHQNAKTPEKIGVFACSKLPGQDSNNA